ncbi:hypothetical protein J7E91_32605 [Streptomyces sp. ISL-99]|uniref:hypothetical protein n=1 Tax=Streptomyces sp. ISL-99 TaxID=2819193 RepID=UPI001BEAFC0E|nr:hypothetical protein [Streptomyces sp. ISL-99]MBT2529974.1 hypothetical protein [Streptomyces sp. ISL-99]
MAEHKQWRPMQRFTRNYAATHRAVANLVFDRAAQRAARHKPSNEVPVGSMAC